MTAGLVAPVREVEVVEVLLRDGLQNESVIVATDDKVRWAHALVDAGLRRIEAVSFAHPRLVPAMADAEALMERVPRVPGVSYAGLVLNHRGLVRALDSGVDEVNVVVCVSDTFSRRNQNVSTEAALDAALQVVEEGREAGLVTTVTLATSFGCPFEGHVDPDRVAEVAARAAEAEPSEICLADTIGVGVPAQVTELARLVGAAAPDPVLRWHFHDTRNTGTANAWAAIGAGSSVLDASAGGFGGCPFAPRATGNVATEDLAYLLDRSGIATGIDLGGVVGVAETAAVALGKPPASSLARAGGFPQLPASTSDEHGVG